MPSARRQAQATTAPADPEWITLREAARILQIHPNCFYRVLAASRIRKLQYPGLSPMYSRVDVLRIRADAVRDGQIGEAS